MLRQYLACKAQFLRGLHHVAIISLLTCHDFMVEEYTVGTDYSMVGMTMSTNCNKPLKSSIDSDTGFSRSNDPEPVPSPLP